MANNPNSKEKIAARKAARKASGMSAQKFYVTTRLAEAAKSGKKLDKATLRKKFQSGDVARKGFKAPKKKSATYTPGMGGNPNSSTTAKTGKGVAKGTYKSGGLYASGRAIPPAPKFTKMKP